MADVAINDQTKTTTISGSDVIPLYDASAGAGRGAEIQYLPISTAVQTALDLKQDEFATGTLTISNGVVAIPNDKDGRYEIDTEGAASTDDLDSFTGLSQWNKITICPASDARTIVVKNSASIALNGGVDFTMNNANDCMELMSKGGGVLIEVSRSSNGS